MNMIKTAVTFSSAFIFLMGLSSFCPGAFAQGHQEGYYEGHAGIINGGSGHDVRSNAQRMGHGTRHYYHNGNWNRNGWFGWGNPEPVFSNGVLIASLPPGYTSVVVSGNTYFYGNNTYFSQLPSGGYVVVSAPLMN